MSLVITSSFPAIRAMQRLLLLVPVVGSFFGCTQPNEYQPPPPPEVKVSKPLVHDVTIYLEETGTTEAVEKVEVRARVRGFLEKVSLVDGADVEVGDELYVIEPREYEANVQAAEAALALAKAEKDLARADLDREESLFKKESTSKANLDSARARDKSAAAAIQAAEAELNRAKQDLEYTQIQAPIAGRVERTLVKLGNLVGEGEATHLTTIINYDPIYVYFNVSERSLLRATAAEEAARAEAGASKEAPLKEKPEKKITDYPAYLRRATDKGFPFVGNLDYYDLGVDQSTGTFTLRGIFPNPNEKILPGLFVRIRVPLGTRKDAILIPERSVGADQTGRYVMVIGEDNVAERRNVVLGSKFGEMVVIMDGVEENDMVVIDGLQRARPGATVTTKDASLEIPPELLKKPDTNAVIIDEPEPTQTEENTQDGSSDSSEGQSSESTDADESAESGTSTAADKSDELGADPAGSSEGVEEKQDSTQEDAATDSAN